MQRMIHCMSKDALDGRLFCIFYLAKTSDMITVNTNRNAKLTARNKRIYDFVLAG